MKILYVIPFSIIAVIGWLLSVLAFESKTKFKYKKDICDKFAVFFLVMFFVSIYVIIMIW